jgi:hypothetical protein
MNLRIHLLDALPSVATMASQSLISSLVLDLTAGTTLTPAGRVRIWSR